jgi:hypothetical protein
MLTFDHVNLAFTQVVFNRFYCSAKPECHSAFWANDQGVYL